VNATENSRQRAAGSGQLSVVRSQEPGVRDSDSRRREPTVHCPACGSPCASVVKKTVSVPPCLRGEKTRRGFTLIELLVVIIIIGILAGLITAAAIPAVRAVRRMTIVGEMSQLDMAMERYKQERGDYPPDFCGVYDESNSAARDAVLNHLRRAFPRYRPGQNPNLPASADTDWEKFAHDVNYATRTVPSDPDTGINLGTDINNIEDIEANERMTPASALVFWLGGLPAPAGSSTRLIPFSANPANPFAVGGSRLESFFEFDETRLVREEDADKTNRSPYCYQPPHVQDPDGGPDAPPYVYFRAMHDEYDPSPTGRAQFFPWGSTLCVPYGKEADLVEGNPDGNPNTNDPAIVNVTKWFNPDTFQVVCCGLDGLYSTEKLADIRTERSIRIG